MKKLVVLLMVLSMVAGAVGRCYHDGLTEARAATKAARESVKAAIATADVALDGEARAKARSRQFELQRDSALKVADEATKNESAALDALDALQLPDTCAPAIQLAEDVAANASIVESSLRVALEKEKSAHAETKFALDTTSAALRDLRAAAARLSDATKTLEHSSRPSLLARLLPRPGFGGAVGVDPETGRLSKTAGITLGWTF